MWARCFAALGISYKGATMTLDLCDREGKYSNGVLGCLRLGVIARIFADCDVLHCTHCFARSVAFCMFYFLDVLHTSMHII